MPDQDWKTGPLDRKKYVIRKTCKECGGSGDKACTCGARGMDDCTCMFFSFCEVCGGHGSIPVDPAAAYFVLRIDNKHDPNALIALAAYADSVELTNQEFAAGLREWMYQLSQPKPKV